MQEKKDKDKPKERVREWREAREWGGAGREKDRRKLEWERMRVEEWKRKWGREGRKKGRKKEKEEGRKKSNNLKAFLHNDSITHAAKENQIAYEE